jgi:hypothetical protein
LSDRTIQGYELIFIGHTSSVTSCDEEGKSRVLFVIDSLFKGKAFKNTEIQFDCASSCAMSFAPGERWLIYAKYVRYGLAEVQLCSHSRKKAASETEDYAVSSHGNTFTEAVVWLSKNIGIRDINIDDERHEPTRELIHPDQKQSTILIVIGLFVVVGLYFIVKRYLH